jgi:hypothetical protein
MEKLQIKSAIENQIIQKIEDYFKVPDRVADKVKNIAEKVRGGYVLIESRTPWDGSIGPWIKTEVAKIIFHKPSGKVRLYWKRASGEWEYYSEYKTFSQVLEVIEKDSHGCFWG